MIVQSCLNGPHDASYHPAVPTTISALVHCIMDFRSKNLLSVRDANKTLEIGSSRTASASKDGSLAKDKSRRCAPCQGNSAAGEARALSKDHAFGRMRLGVYYALEEAF